MLNKIRDSLKRLDKKSRAIAVGLFMLPAGFILSLVFLLFAKTNVVDADKKELRELKKENTIL